MKGGWYFNSIKVRLELSSFIASTSRTEFQFHKGAIRTKFRIYDSIAEMQFQFHKGAIRTTAK